MRSLIKPIRNRGFQRYNTRFRRFLSLAHHIHKPKHQGSGYAPIIFLHGLFGSKQNNRSISKVLANDLQTKVYALDLRNHGDSPHVPLHDYSTMADDVEEFLLDHKIKFPILIGHSMGAKVAMTLALRRPELPSCLIPVDNAPINADLKSQFYKYVQGMKEIEDAHVTKQAEADAILAKYEEVLPVRQFLLTNLVRFPGEEYLKFRIPVETLTLSLDSMGDFPFKDPKRAHFDGPTLIIRGLKSHYVDDDILPFIRPFFPRFEVRDIECGHWVISEKPEAFRQAVVDFLRTKRRYE